MELDCTMLPMKPSARMMSTENTVASTLPTLPLERGADIVRRAARDMAVHRGLVVLRQHGLGVNGRHAEKRRHPGPEQRARAAADQRRGAARDVAGADLRRNGRRQRLKAAHALGVRLFAAQRKAAEHTAEALAKAAHLHAAQPHGKVHTRADQQKTAAASSTEYR